MVGYYFEMILRVLNANIFLVLFVQSVITDIKDLFHFPNMFLSYMSSIRVLSIYNSRLLY
jgi:hypothetical protein